MKIVLALVVVVLSALLLAAHFLRDAQFLGVAFSLGTPMVLLARRAWAVRVTQAFLVVAAGVWAFTAAGTVQQRLDAGRPWIRLLAILGAVTLLALAGALLLQARSVRRRLVRP